MNECTIHGCRHLQTHSRLFSFSEMIDGLKEGKKFRRPHFRQDSFIMLGINKQRIKWNMSGDNFPLDISDVEANDWIEVKE